MFIYELTGCGFESCCCHLSIKPVGLIRPEFRVLDQVFYTEKMHKETNNGLPHFCLILSVIVTPSKIFTSISNTFNRKSVHRHRHISFC